MTFPREWIPGERITAERLNEAQRSAAVPRGSISLGNGASLVNEAMANQSSDMRKQALRLVIANENFQIPGISTDLIPAAIDQVPSGPCNMVRLNRATGNYQNETLTLPFRAYDVLAAMGSSSYKTKGEIFYVGYNEDTKRWEVLGGGGGSQRIRFIVKEVMCNGTETSVNVKATHYTGGCGATPPGTDAYTGFITVIDDCILSYFTATSLIGKKGSATYMYPIGAYCIPVWIVDDVCGAPECT